MAEGHVELQERLVQQSIQTLSQHLETERSPSNFVLARIGKVPSRYRDGREHIFTSWAACTGLVHKEGETVQAFKKHKIHYVTQLLRLVTQEAGSLMETCITKVCTLMNSIKNCYAEVNFEDDDRETAYMLCEDSLFILGFFLACFEPGDHNSHSENMPAIETILHDLVLLENQIPFFILVEIYNLTILTIKPNTTLATLLSTVLSRNNPFPVGISIHNNSTNDVPHLLGFLHQCYMPLASQGSSSYPRSRIPSVASLLKAGVNLKPNQNSQSGLAMKVTVCNNQCLRRGDATLEMPVLHVGVGTESVLWNFIVYEMLHTSSKPIASYLQAMGMLVKTEEDVHSLEDSRVLFNSMGTDEKVANMIKTMLENVAVVDFFYEEEWKELNKYCNVNSWLRRIMCTWRITILMLFIGIFSLTAAVIQDVYEIKPAENKNRS